MAFDKQILNNDVDVIAKLAVGGDYDFGLLATVGTERYFRAIGTEANIIINLIPKGSGTLRVPTGYEALINNGQDLINKAYGDSKIGGQPIDPTLITPGEDEDGFSIVWDFDTGSYILAPSSNTKTFGSGVEDVSNVIKWGGPALDRHTDILGAGTFDVKLGTTASKLLNFEMNAVTKAELIAGTAKLILNGASPVILLGGAAESTIEINVGGGIIITDNQAGASRRGLRGADNYSGNVVDNDYVQKIYTDNRIGGKSVDSLLKAPTSVQNGHAIVWNQALNMYTLSDTAGESTSTIPKKQKFIASEGQTAFTVTNGTILYLNFVEINGDIQAEGDDFSRSGQTINTSPGLAAGYELTVYYWEDLSLGTGGGGGGSIQNGHFLFSTSTVEADPTDGKVRFNTSNFTTVTEIYIDSLTLEGQDLGATIQDMATGDEIRLQLASNDDNNTVYKLLSMPINNSGWWTLLVSNVYAAGSFFLDTADLVVILMFKGSVLLETNVDGGVANSIYNTLPVIDGGGV